MPGVPEDADGEGGPQRAEPLLQAGQCEPAPSELLPQPRGQEEHDEVQAQRDQHPAGGGELGLEQGRRHRVRGGQDGATHPEEHEQVPPAGHPPSAEPPDELPHPAPAVRDPGDHDGACGRAEQRQRGREERGHHSAQQQHRPAQGQDEHGERRDRMPLHGGPHAAGCLRDHACTVGNRTSRMTRPPSGAPSTGRYRCPAKRRSARRRAARGAR